MEGGGPVRAALVGALLVAAADAAAAQHHVSFAGEGAIGRSLTVEVRGDPSASAFVAVSFGLRRDPVPTPLGPLRLAAPLTVLHQGTFPGELTLSLPLPDDPALVGQLVFAQVLASPDPPSREVDPERSVGTLTTGGGTPVARTTIVDRGTDFSRRFDVLVLNFDPIVDSRGGRRLHEVLGFHDPRVLAQRYVDAMRVASGGYVDQVIVDWVDLDVYPVKEDGFRYDDDTYLANWAAGGGWHVPDLSDYDAIIDDNDLTLRVSTGEIDEVFLFGAPFFGYYESRMAGPNAYWVNSPGMAHVQSTRKFVLMGFNYERGLDSMLHDYGHRIESIMTRVYGSWNNGAPPRHLWDEFSRYDLIDPGGAGLGNTHFPPNGQADYDYGNPTPVLSTCDDWRDNFPNLQGTRRMIDASEWGASEEGFLRWYFDHFPRRQGRLVDRRLGNWWKYTHDFNAYALTN